MNTSEIIILCNSPQCLNEISSGLWPNMHKRNLFTCNLAYTYFRTTGRHLNIFSDARPIHDFISHAHWHSVYGTHPYNDVEFIYSNWEIKKQVPIKSEFAPDLKKSPISVPGSSAINALLHIAYVENFEKIYLVGYTLREWEGLRQVKELKSKQDALDELLKKYAVTSPRPYVYEYTLKK